MDGGSVDEEGGCGGWGVCVCLVGGDEGTLCDYLCNIYQQYLLL